MLMGLKQPLVVEDRFPLLTEKRPLAKALNCIAAGTCGVTLVCIS